jgi:hypothetical protein
MANPQGGRKTAVPEAPSLLAMAGEAAARVAPGAAVEPAEAVTAGREKKPGTAAGAAAELAEAVAAGWAAEAADVAGLAAEPAVTTTAGCETAAAATAGTMAEPVTTAAWGWLAVTESWEAVTAAATGALTARKARFTPATGSPGRRYAAVFGEAR